MHTLCRHLQIYCRHNADYHISVQLEYFFVVISKCGYCRVNADFMHTSTDLCRHYADIMQALISISIIHVCNWRVFLLLSVATFLTVL